MADWYMLTVVGRDRPGIVARITGALYRDGCDLGEASMMRLGGNFTIMLMACCDGDRDRLSQTLRAVTDDLDLRVHVDRIDASLHDHPVPDLRISVHGADRPGIVAQVTGVLAETGFNIVDLESDVAGTEQAPIYVMHIEGVAGDNAEAVAGALEPLRQTGIELHVTPVDVMVA